MKNRLEINLARPPKGLRFEVEAVADPVFSFSADIAAPTISIFAMIGLDATAQGVAAALRAIGNRPVTVEINSPGGDFYEGVAIYSLLSRHPQPVTVQILGLAASAASVVAMAGTKIEVARNADIMIHNAWGIRVGNASVMREASDYLDRLSTVMAEIYAARTGLPLDQVKAMMEIETFLPSGEALSLGFADALLAQDAAPPPRKLAIQSAAHSKKEFETHLQRVGYARAAASRLAAGGWPALSGAVGEADDLDQIQARLAANITEIKALT